VLAANQLKNNMSTTHAPPKKSQWSWRSQAFRGLVYQGVAVSVIVSLVWLLASNTMSNMAARGIQSGFDFLTQTAGFDIGETPIPYDSGQGYWRAFLVGLANTLRVAVVGIVLTTILGTMVGVGRFSRNALVRGICMVYVEFFRNIPVLLQLFMWYIFLTELLPDSWEPWQLGNFFLSKGGVSFPAPLWAFGHLTGFIGFMAGMVGVVMYRRRAQKLFEATGQLSSSFWIPIGMLFAGAFIGWFVGGAPSDFNTPVKGDFAIEHGAAVTPEFLTVLLGLTMYTAAFVAEVVRAGIQSVPDGQSEAASALGLSKGHTMKLIMLPQALRVIIPPMTNQFLNLTKNSSLAVAIGYPDIVSVTNTALNQTGRAVECIAIVMMVYLSTSLATSMFMNWYNKRSEIKER
jgi:general L-amino acid transport system permease protein